MPTRPRVAIALVLMACLLALPLRDAAQAQSVFTSDFDAAAPEEPLKVAVGVMIRQITGVDQKAENYGVVARIRMGWKSDALAYDAAERGRGIRTLAYDEFVAEARKRGVLVPVFTIENQQSRSFEKTSVVAWFPDGSALLAQEVILTLQAPDFDFRRFPFDHQSFFFRITANAPDDYVVFQPLAEASGVGDTLGEEEWIVASNWTEVDTAPGISGEDSSRFSLGFSAHRHLLYYWVRIFIPVILVTLIGWANLFLEDYRRRIDIASGNLLAFIALNFTISSELPRLGYMTFIDSLLMAVFVISVASVVYNVALHRMSTVHRESRAKVIDWHVTYWAYPLIFPVVVGLLYLVFFA